MNPYRGHIDWAQVAGVEGPGRTVFATLKASGSHGGGQDRLAAHWAREAPEMAASGIPLVGGCHRLYPGDEFLQVRDFLARMNLVGGIEGRLCQLDAEAASPSSVRAWMNEWNRPTDGYPVLGYLPDWAESGWPASDLRSYGFAAWWASEYVAGTGSNLELYAKVTEDKWHPWDGVPPLVLQYSSSATVPGVPGNCDVNAYRGTLAELREMATVR